MSIKDLFKDNKNSFLFWFIILAVAVFSFSAGYLIAFEINPVPIIVEKCSEVF